MHTDPFRNAAKGRPLSKEELGLRVVVDPDVDYFAKADEWALPWTPPRVDLREEGPAISNEVLREVLVPGKDEDEPHVHVVGHRRYYRAVNPSGSIMQLVVASSRPDHENPSGVDPEYESRQIRLKSRRGWLVLERDSATWNPYAPYRDEPQKYAAWCLTVANLRRKKYREAADKEARVIMDRQLAVARESAQIQGEVLAGAIQQAVREIRAEEAPPKKAA